MDFTIPPEYLALKKLARDFCQNEVAPVANEIEAKAEPPMDIVRKAGKLGLMGLLIPKKYGGVGCGLLGYVLVAEELGQSGSSSLGNIMGAHSLIGSMGICISGTDEQKKKYLPKMATGELIGAFALTEPNAGSDAASIRMRADLKGDKWYLNGTKLWITNGTIAHVITTMAVNDPMLGARGGVSAFIVENTSPGFSIGVVEDKMGTRAAPVAELVYNNCEVPRENMLGKMGLGFLVALSVLDLGRISLGAGCVGGAWRLMNSCIAHAKNRVQFGKPIIEHQAVAFMIADMAIGIYAMRNMVLNAAWKYDSGRPITIEGAMVKAFCSETMCKIVDNAVQVHGGMGYMKSYPIERAYRDTRILRIYEGTNEIQRVIIARDLEKGKWTLD